MSLGNRYQLGLKNIIKTAVVLTQFPMPLSSFQALYYVCAVCLPLSTTNNTVMFIGFHGKFNMFQELAESCITCTRDFPESTITMTTVCCFWMITLCGSFFWHLLLRKAFYLGSGPLILMQDNQACNSKREMSWWLSQLYSPFLVLIASSIHSAQKSETSFVLYEPKQ